MGIKGGGESERGRIHEEENRGSGKIEESKEESDEKKRGRELVMKRRE